MTGAILGAVQGLTEFLPISSDGHLAIGAILFGQTDTPLPFVVFLHIGTLVATLLVLRAEVGELVSATASGIRSPREFFATDHGRELAAIIAATVPTGVIGLLLKDFVVASSNDLRVVGACLLGSAAMVASTRFTNHGERNVLGIAPAFFLGACQALAVLPGLSRSGTTIGVAMLLGLRAPRAFRFSFLLSLPAVAGAVLLESTDLAGLEGYGAAALVGSVVAFLFGYVALKMLRDLLDRGRFWAFALYLFPLGVGLLLWNPPL
ncbi:MAG: undecaprenyl-diphosphate phosphatase [Polyangiaceae bacterium]|nr:undecaprenyl-diphosphate phosphatase [Polyangiaceae bacterium]